MFQATCVSVMCFVKFASMREAKAQPYVEVDVTTVSVGLFNMQLDSQYYGSKDDEISSVGKLMVARRRRLRHPGGSDACFIWTMCLGTF